MIGRLKDLLRTAGGEWVVSFTTKADPREIFDKFTDKDVNIEIKKASARRSKTANDFCWAMCTDIGNSMRPPVPKEEVYRMAIRDVGKYVDMDMKEDAVETFKKIWGARGIGWFVEVVDDSDLPGSKKLFCYLGSSVYSTDTMSRLIDYLKSEMVNLGLSIPLGKEEEKRLLEKWGK